MVEREIIDGIRQDMPKVRRFRQNKRNGMIFKEDKSKGRPSVICGRPFKLFLN